jgi:lipopolysaccharide heptosyltransferase I
LNEPREILIVKPSSLGDVVHTLPAAMLIKQRWPSAKLRWLVNAEWAPLLEGSPYIDEILIFPRRDFRGARGSLRIAPWARSLRDRVNADLVLDFQGLLRSALMAKLCRGAGGRIVGLGDAREGARFFYDQRVDVSDCAHAVDRYLALVRALEIPVPDTLCWPLPEGVTPAGFDATERFVALHPFSRGRGKSLSVSDVESFCRALAPTRVVIAGQSREPVTQIPNVIDLLNRTTLPELVWLLRHAAFVVSVDSGPMHIAAALGTPLIAIHTWSDPTKVGPYNRDAWVWKDGALAQVLDLAHTHSAPDFAALAAFVRKLAFA